MAAIDDTIKADNDNISAIQDKINATNSQIGIQTENYRIYAANNKWGPTGADGATAALTSLNSTLAGLNIQLKAAQDKLALDNTAKQVQLAAQATVAKNSTIATQALATSQTSTAVADANNAADIKKYGIIAGVIVFLVVGVIVYLKFIR